MGLDFSWLADPYYQRLLLSGAWTTCQLSFMGMVLAFLLGLAGETATHFRAGIIRTSVGLVVDLLRNTPPLVQLFFLYFALSQMGISLRNPATGREEPLFDGFACVVLMLGLFYGANLVEVLRSGIEGVPSETIEAGRSLGYSKWQIYIYIELPIGLRLGLPAMTNNMVSLIKTTTEASLVAVTDIMYYSQQIVTDTFRNMEVMIFIWSVYLGIVSVFVAFARKLERRISVSGYARSGAK